MKAMKAKEVKVGYLYRWPEISISGKVMKSYTSRVTDIGESLSGLVAITTECGVMTYKHPEEAVTAEAPK